ncbi:MAG: hypothetical protein AAFU79_04595 [Myxococcota bacterium]
MRVGLVASGAACAGGGRAAQDRSRNVALDIAHGVRFVLVDAQRGVRGLYDTDDVGIKALLADARLLVAAAPRANGKPRP